MAITLGQLRTFCQEVATKDASGSTAHRQFMHMINNALEKLYNEVSLDATRREIKLHVPAAASRTDIAATQNSGVFTSATGFLDIWRSDRYSVQFATESRMDFEISSLNGPLTQATMRSGDEWLNATATGLTAYFVKNKFNIPTVARIMEVRLLDGRVVPYASPEIFDRLRQRGPTHRSAYPLACTYRNDYLEVWPAPGDEAYKLSVTYRKAFTPFSSAAVADGGDADATTVDWPDRHLGILKKAIMVEGALIEGMNAPSPHAVVYAEFMQALEQLQDQASKEAVPGPLTIQTPIQGRPRGRYSLPPGGEVVES